jgi:hypothetical protein
MAKSMTFVLRDDPAGGKNLKGRIVKEGGGIGIYVDGFGNAEGPPGKMPVAALVLQDGQLKLVTFPDYNNPEHTTINLDGAKIP